jgi:hypothetical protein
VSTEPLRADPYIAHDYRLSEIDTHARYAVMGHRSRWSGGNVAEQMDTARFAILELLYTADERPERLDLIQAGQRAVAAAKEADMRFYRIPVSDRETGAGFAKFWFSIVDPGFEDRVVDRLALHHILPEVQPRHQQALLALAAAGNYQDGAELMGVGANTFQTWISRGRTRFRELWHEHEAPSGQWGRDRRVGARVGTTKRVKPQNSAAARVRKLRRQATPEPQELT